MNILIQQCKKPKLIGIVASLVFLTGCGSFGGGKERAEQRAAEQAAAELAVATRQAELDQRSAELDKQAAELAALSGASSGQAADDLLPPNAAPGECYARVWVDAEYVTETEQVVVSEESQKIEIIPAKYETVTETIEVSSASERLETIPAVYGTETETIKVRDGKLIWRVGPNHHDAPANSALLDAARQSPDFANATPGMCLHEHYVPQTTSKVKEQVIVKEATEKVTIVPAVYEEIEERVLVKEASTKLVTVPAEYEVVEEQVVDKPKHTIWKKGTGPIQKIDESTGEIMCLVEVPATYKTVKRTVLKTPATTRTMEIPAEYRTVRVKKLVSPASETRTPVAAEYAEVEREVVDAEAGFVWHEVHNKTLPASTRTGNRVCLTETKPEYKTVHRTVVKSPAQTRRVAIPAKQRSVDVVKLVSPAREEVTVIPAKYGEVEKRVLVKDGYMTWRSILCETNMTISRIADIQQALINRGYDIGPRGADGVIGVETIRAVNAFQRATGLPVDKYLNVETVEALGVSTQ